jgi:cell division protein FtsW
MKIGWQAQKMGNLYGAFICFGIATLFGLQIVINLGVNTGLLPTKGLTLPFFSYGGSSLIICCVMVALVYRVSVEVDAAVANEKTKTIKKVTRKTKNNSVSAVFADKQINSDGMNEYVTGFDAYVEELNGGRNDK